MSPLVIYTLAALAEIVGCFSFWAWLRLDKPLWVIIPGIISLLVFAWLLTLTDAEYAGRAYVIYGSIYIGVSLVWLWVVEGQKPDGWDITGVSICVVGGLVMLLAPRAG